MTTKDVLLILLALAIVACLQDSIRGVIVTPLKSICWLCERAHVWVVGRSAALRQMISERLREIGLGEGRWRASYVLGGLISTLAFAVFAVAEGTTIALSLEAMGLGAVSLPPALQRVDVILTGSILGAGVYAAWAAHVLDDEAPSLLVVQHWHSAGARRILRRIAGVAFALVVIVVIGLGALRAHELALAEEEIVPAGELERAAQGGAEAMGAGLSSDRVVTAIRYSVSISGAVALMLVSAVSWALGPAQLLTMGAVLATFGLLLAVTVLSWIAGGTWIVARAVRTLVVRILDALLAVATPVARAPVTLLLQLNGWARARDHAPPGRRAFMAFIDAFTSPAWDLQVPHRRGSEHHAHGVSLSSHR
jgi:hypothetical protein